MKTHRLQVVPTPATLAARDHDQARQELRRFARFCAQQDPEALAAEVRAVSETLATCAQIEIFFRRYVRGLRQGQPQ
jgi:hypothetical protein